MRKILVSALLFGAATQAGAVVVPNGNFESGYTDFTSSYTPVVAPGTSPNALQDEGKYAVGTNAALYHSSWASFFDHTSGDGSGNYMIVNGAGQANVNVYSTASISLDPGVYQFSFWLASLYAESPAQLVIAQTPTGLMTLGTANASSTTGQWSQFTSNSFAVYTPTSYTFAINNSNTALSGNDFGLDDVALVQVGEVPEPASWAIMVGGFGLLGATMRRRRVNFTYA